MVVKTRVCPAAWAVLVIGEVLQKTWKVEAFLPVAGKCHVSASPSPGRYVGASSASAAGGTVSKVTARTGEPAVPVASMAWALNELRPSNRGWPAKVNAPAAEAFVSATKLPERNRRTSMNGSAVPVIVIGPALTTKSAA